MTNVETAMTKPMILLKENGELVAHVQEPDGTWYCKRSSGCPHGYAPHPQPPTAASVKLL